jgi:hypothetical protein
MKVEAFAQMHAFSAALEQAWDAAEELQPHLGLRRAELRRVYVRRNQARFATLVVLTERSADRGRGAEHRIRKLKARWEAAERERHRKQGAEEPLSIRNKREKKSKGRNA